MEPPCFSGRSPCRPQRLFAKPVPVTGDTRPALPRTRFGRKGSGASTQNASAGSHHPPALLGQAVLLSPHRCQNCNIGFILVFFPPFVKEFIRKSSGFLKSLILQHPPRPSGQQACRHATGAAPQNHGFCGGPDPIQPAGNRSRPVQGFCRRQKRLDAPLGAGII